MEKKYLPLGTIIELAEKKYMIIGRVTLNMENGVHLFKDYTGVPYPVGFEFDNYVFFNEEDIEKVLAKGFEDEEGTEFQQELKTFRNKSRLPFGC